MTRLRYSNNLNNIKMPIPPSLPTKKIELQHIIKETNSIYFKPNVENQIIQGPLRNNAANNFENYPICYENYPANQIRQDFNYPIQNVIISHNNQVYPMVFVPAQNNHPNSNVIPMIPALINGHLPHTTQNKMVSKNQVFTMPMVIENGYKNYYNNNIPFIFNPVNNNY